MRIVRARDGIRRGARRRATRGRQVASATTACCSSISSTRPRTSRSRYSPTPRQRRAPVRARLLGAAPPPEGASRKRRPRDRRRATRAAMGEAAVAAARAVGYAGRRHGRVPRTTAGALLLHGDEHAAAGRASGHRDDHRARPRRVAVARRARASRLPLAQEQIRRRGHAVEARLYAEDPERGFLPSTGTLHRSRLPAPSRARARSTPASRRATRSRVHYDPMIAKIIAWAPDRRAAFAGCARARGNGHRGRAQQCTVPVGHRGPPRVAAARSTHGCSNVSCSPMAASRPGKSAMPGCWPRSRACRSTTRTMATDHRPGTRATAFASTSRLRSAVPLASGGEAHWLRVERDDGRYRVELDGTAHRVVVNDSRPVVWQERSTAAR